MVVPRLNKKQPSNPISLNVQVIANVITPLGLEPDEEVYANGELKWLFSAAANYLQVYQTVQQRLDEEKTQLIRKFAGDILADRKRTEAMAQLAPQIWQAAVEACQVITEPIPPEAKRSAQANNKLLDVADDFQYQQWGKTIESKLNLVDSHLKSLRLLLERETLQGPEAKANIALQNQIKLERLSLVEELEELAAIFYQAYGILVTSPGELVELLRS